MIGIIPIMGVGQRFKDAGYTTPKHLIEVFPGVTILEKIISTFNGEPVYIGCRQEYFDGILKIVKEGGYNVHIHTFEYDLSAIETTLKLLEHVYCNHQPIVVHYCDVFLPEGFHDMPTGELAEAYFSLAEVSERNTFSEYWGVGIGGVYWFKDKETLLKRSEENHNAKTMGEIVETGRRGILTCTQIDIGTPEAYKAYLKANGFGIAEG